MEQEIKALKNDPKTIEKEARERLRYARPGEVVYTFSLPQLRSRRRRSSFNWMVERLPGVGRHFQ